MKVFMEGKKKTDKRKIYALVVGIMLVVAIVIGVSFAYIKIEATQGSENKIATLCLNIKLEEETSAIELVEAYPLSDEEGLRLAPYKFTITNECTSTVDYQVNLDILTDVENDETALALEHIKMSLNSTTPTMLSNYTSTSPVTEAGITSKLIASGELRQNQSKSYDLRLWIDEETTIEEGANKFFSSKIAVTGTSHTQIYGGDLLLAAYVDDQSVDTIPGRGAYTVEVDCKGNGNGFWDYNNWGAVVTNFTSGASCDVIFTSQKYFSDYIIDASKTDATIVELTQGSTVQTGENATTEYRYSGDVVNNWVYFGCSDDCTEDNLYRIIGVFPTQETVGGEYKNRVKLIKANYYTESTSGYLENGSNAPGGQGYRWNKSSGSNVWASSTLKNYVLNGVYWDSLGEYQTYITPAVWYLGAPNSTGYSAYTPNKLYVEERSYTKAYNGGESSIIANIGLMYPSDYGYSIEKSYWDQAIYSNAGTYVYNAWLYNLTSSTYEWTMTPESNYYSSTYGACAWSLTPAGYVGYYTVYNASHVYGVRPVFYLDSEVLYYGGVGSSSNPYKILIGE